MPSKRREIQDDTTSRHSLTSGSPKCGSLSTVDPSHTAVGSVLSSENVALFVYPVLCYVPCVMYRVLCNVPRVMYPVLCNVSCVMYSVM